MDAALLIISTLIFLGGFVFSVAALRTGKFRTRRANLALIGLGFLIQCFFLYRRGQFHGRCPITDGAEILVFVAWSLAIMYFVLGPAFRLSLLGTFTAPILGILHLAALILSLIFPAAARPVTELDPWLELHAATSLLAYGAFALAAVASVMFLIQNRQLKSGTPGRLSFRLPPIRYLNNALVRLLGIGLFLLTAGVVAALFMKKAASYQHLGLLGGVWIIYTAILLFFLVRRPSSRWLSVVSLIAFAVALLTLSAI